MSYITADPTTKIRYAAAVLPAVGAASGQGVSQFVATNDDNKNRRLTGMYSTFQTKLLKFHIRVAGKEIAVVDAASIAAAAGYLPLDQNYQGNVQLEYTIESNNPGGPAIVANTDEIVFRYEAVPDVSA